ncbi:putative cytochrome P450 6a14 [Blattella germanica]|nr:putative cytochrome P450 6a14 [Blattella germanica]
MVGSESPSSIMAFCLYELAINTDIQERVRQEISDVLEKHDGKMSYGCVKEMTYLDQVISEILRMYPTIPMLAREVTKEYTIPGTDIVLEKGTQIIIPIQGIHRDSKYYPNPAKFDPDRFSEEQKKKRHPQAFLPHGDGPRMCIGIRFGLMQTKVGLVSLLSKFKFDVSKKTSLPMKIDRKSFLVMKPDGGMWLQITKH